jgi:hypothetical protein
MLLVVSIGYVQHIFEKKTYNIQSNINSCENMDEHNVINRLISGIVNIQISFCFERDPTSVHSCDLYPSFEGINYVHV